MREISIRLERLVLLSLMFVCISQIPLTNHLIPQALSRLTIFSGPPKPAQSDIFSASPSANTVNKPVSEIEVKTPGPCVPQPYKIHIFSNSPLVIYIEDFISKSEIDYLIQAAEPSFLASTIRDLDSTDSKSEDIRKSQSAQLMFDNTTICIGERAAAFQGLSLQNLELVQVVKYGLNDYFNEHFDWFGQTLSIEETYTGDRRSTFFGYLQADNLTGGGTNFPHLKVLDNREGIWCQFIECHSAREESVTFKAIPGNAIYWQNLGDNGTGLTKVLHSGMPVLGGRKIGMNLWTRQRRLWEWCDSSPWGMVPANVPCLDHSG